MRQALILLLIMLSPWAMAETVYINDKVFVGVRSKPNSREEPLKVLTTGTRLELLESKEKFLRIRTEEGVEGWINKLYASPEPPARALFEILQAEYEMLDEELESSRITNSNLQQERELLKQRISALEADNSRLNTELNELHAASESFLRRYGWQISAAATALLFLLGLILGVQWYRYHVSKRLGGLRV